VGLLGIILIGSTVRLSGARKPPDLTTSCTVPALALSTPTIRIGGPLRYTTVGPTDRIVVAIDATKVAADGTATPLAGHTETQVIPQQQLTDCRVSGILGVQVQPGEHVIGVFPAAGGGPLTTQPLTVTQR
jgi:hypothetical protein